MNIFLLDKDPMQAALYHSDQHLHKMILEGAQMLSTVLVKRGVDITGIYKATHHEHPCVKWLERHEDHIQWLLQMMFALDEIRQHRGSAEHASMRVVKIFCDYYGTRPSPVDLMTHTDFAVCVAPAVLRVAVTGNAMEQAIARYRLYYVYKRREWHRLGKRPMSWSGQTSGPNIPEFMYTEVQFDEPV